MNNILTKNSDIDNFKRIADIYSSSTQINTSVINGKGDVIHSCPVNYDPCKICKDVNGVSSCPRDCMIYGSYQAKRFENKYMFFCPLGLTLWISPIFENNILKVSYICGPVNLTIPDDISVKIGIDNFDLDENKKKELSSAILNTPVIQTDKSNSMLELLALLTSSMSTDLLDTDKHKNMFSYIDKLKCNNSSLEYPIEKEKELTSSISIGNREEAQKLLNDLLGFVFFSTGNFKMIKIRALEFVTLISRAAIEGGANSGKILDLSYEYIDKINNIENIDELTNLLSKILSVFTDNVLNLSQVKNVDVIFKAISYIRENYMNKITLEDIASHVHLSPTYFSKIFKKETKNNYIYYLNAVRIEKSKAFILDDDIHLVDIPNMVGFEDQSYFSKTFKSYIGISPGQYRKKRGKI